MPPPSEKGNPSPSRNVNKIIGGCHHPNLDQPTKRRSIPIVFLEEDDQELQFPQNDAAIITLNVENYDVCHIIIDNESLADILHFDALLKMGISLDRLTLVDSPLVGFTDNTIQVEEMISITIWLGHYPL